MVEDSELDYELVTAHLRQNGYALAVEKVEDEASLRRALTRQPWDVVLSDHRLPYFDSVGALSVVRELAPDLPFIVVSGVLGEELAVDSIQSGADDYVTKGNLDRLVPALRRCQRVLDIRQQKSRAVADLEEKRAQLIAITSNMPGVVFQLEHRAPPALPKPIFVSDAALRLLNLKEQDWLRDERIWEDLFAPEDMAEFVRLVHACAIDKQTLRWEGRLNSRWLPGAERRARWVELAATVRTTLDGRTLFDGVLMDITRHKRTLGLLSKSRQQLRELSAHLEQAKEEERAVVAREIHDDIGSTLTGLRADLAWLKKRFRSDAPTMEKLEGIGELVDAAVSASKRIMLALRPSVLDFGLVPAIEWQTQEFQKHHGLPCAFIYNSEDFRLQPAVSTALFRILQEALTNVAKHAQATKVEVELFATDDEISLEVRDDGVGITPLAQAKPTAFGIRGIHERVERLGGWVEIDSFPPSGTTLMLSVPRTGPAEL
jgi:two-component system, NarL family, sensor histidine kinase UhpB